MKCCARTRFSPELFGLHSRGCKKGSDIFQNIYVIPRGVTESRRINQNDAMAVEVKSVRKLCSACAGSKVSSTEEIYELCKSRPGQGEIYNEPWQYIAVGRKGGETAYRRFSAFYRTHDAIRPSGLTYRPRSVGSKGFIQGHGA